MEQVLLTVLGATKFDVNEVRESTVTLPDPVAEELSFWMTIEYHLKEIEDEIEEATTYHCLPDEVKAMAIEAHSSFVTLMKLRTDGI